LTTAETFMIGIAHDCVLPFPDCWFSVRLSRFVYSPRYWQPTTIRVCRNIWESPLSPLSVIVISKENRNEMGSHEQVLPVRLSFIGDVDDAHPPFFPSFFPGILSPPETGITPFSVLLVDPTGFYLIIYTCPPCIPEMEVVHLLFTVFTFYVSHTIDVVSSRWWNRQSPDRLGSSWNWCWSAPYFSTPLYVHTFV
jgi:hypothetical protein